MAFLKTQLFLDQFYNHSNHHFQNNHHLLLQIVDSIFPHVLFCCQKNKNKINGENYGLGKSAVAPWEQRAFARGGFRCFYQKRAADEEPCYYTSRNKQETDGSRHSTAPPGVQNALCGLDFRKVRQILLRLRQKISSIDAKERKLWSFEEGQSISSLEPRQAWTRPEPQIA